MSNRTEASPIGRLGAASWAFLRSPTTMSANAGVPDFFRYLPSWFVFLRADTFTSMMRGAASP